MTFAAQPVTIVMYHYVRDLAHSRYPRLKSLDVARFVGQLDFLQEHYNVVSMDDVVDALQEARPLPPKAAVLTFDDGYLDHYATVFPILHERGLPGAFYPSVRSATEDHVLAVNKIHFVLASVSDPGELMEATFEYLDRFRQEYGLLSNESYYRRLAVADRFDSAERIFIKRLFQRELPSEPREKILSLLFERYTGEDEGAFSRELYMKQDHLQTMVREGMHVGAHGYSHPWFSALDAAAQREEVIASLGFLETIGVDTSRWTMCFPYGDYDERTTGILKEKHCRVALVEGPGVAVTRAENRYRMARVDTNDLPQESGSSPNEWYEDA